MSREETPDSLLLEKAQVACDWMVRRWCWDTQEVAQGFERVKKRITDDSAINDLRTLRDEGCNEDDLLWLLASCSRQPITYLLRGWTDKPGIESLHKLLGLNPRQLKVLLRQLRRCAKQVERVHSNPHFGVLLTIPTLQHFQGIPKILRQYTSLLEQAARSFGHGSHFYRNLAKARLVSHVKSRTGSWHDREVSALIAAVVHGGYDETIHRAWRTKHHKRLATIDPVITLSPADREALDAKIRAQIVKLRRQSC